MRLNLALFFLSSLLVKCASVQHCTPLTGGYDTVTSYEGKCHQLVYSGEEMSLECASTLMIVEKKKQNLQAILFSTKTPKGIVSFNGTPHPKTNKLYFVKTTHVIRSERNLASGSKSNVKSLRQQGICDISLLPDENVQVLCSATDKDGKMTMGEFKSTEKKTIMCKEQLKGES